MKVYIHKGEIGYVLSAVPLGMDTEIDLPSAWWDIISSVFRMYDSVQDYLGVIYNAKRNN